jgi:spore germination cell wall hydrolase CwlJ-like protein
MPTLLGILISPLLLAGCNQTTGSISAANLTASLTPSFMTTHAYRYTSGDKECLERAMFFESNRSSRAGMVAVGTVVMNRLRSGKHGDTICGVVGERHQFAPGVLTRKMNSKAMPDVVAAAEAVLKGERAPKLKNAMHFHTAGLKFPYKNMHYVAVAGGNAFYEKRGRNWKPLPDEGLFAVASATPATDAPASAETTAKPEVLLASATPVPTLKTTATPAAKPLPDSKTLIAMQEPDAARFGSAQDFDTAAKQAPVMAAAETQDVSQPVMSFQSTPDDTNAIGALIMSQSRPMNEY